MLLVAEVEYHWKVSIMATKFLNIYEKHARINAFHISVLITNCTDCPVFATVVIVKPFPKEDIGYALQSVGHSVQSLGHSVQSRDIRYKVWDNRYKVGTIGTKSGTYGTKSGTWDTKCGTICRKSKTYSTKSRTYRTKEQMSFDMQSIPLTLYKFEIKVEFHIE